MSDRNPLAMRLGPGLAGALALVFAAGTARADQTISYSDPRGDDDGPGTYTYPTDRAYQRGDFDMTGFEIEYDADNVEFHVEVARRIEDPWHSAEWNGNGFSVQFAQVYIDLDPNDPSGHADGLPGINVHFADGQHWNKVVLISPQPASRVNAEISEKAGDMAPDCVVPDRTWARGNTLYARVPRSTFGTSDPTTWGVQVVMQSNEGYPSAHDILTRLVNEYEGPHRFGGGNDQMCDPHIMDILAGQATGAANEADLQHQELSTYVCDGTEYGTWATIGMVYRGAAPGGGSAGGTGAGTPP